MISEVHQPQLALDGVDPSSADVFRALRRTFLLQRQLMETALAAKGSHPGEAMCVRLLDEHEGMSQRDLADILHLSRPRVTAILQRLEKAGAVVRRADERDQRLTRVALTAEGRRLAEELRNVFVACITGTIGALTEDDRGELERLLGSLAEHTTRALDLPPDR
jgi:DNA-binding MarR family transcriptional regulator